MVRYSNCKFEDEGSIPSRVSRRDPWPPCKGGPRVPRDHLRRSKGCNGASKTPDEGSIPSRRALWARSTIWLVRPSDKREMRGSNPPGPTGSSVGVSAGMNDQNLPEFRRYRRKSVAEMRPYTPGESMAGVSISEPDREAGSPKPGDMIARNPKNHADKWLVSAAYFVDNFEPIVPGPLLGKEVAS